MTIVRTMLSRMLFYGLASRGGGFAAQVRRGVRRRMRLQWQPPEIMRQRQLDRLNALLRHATTHVPHYRRMHRSGLLPDNVTDPVEMSRVPLLTKEPMIADPADFLAENIDISQRVPRWTGGSSGDPLHFYIGRDSVVRFGEAETWGNMLAGWRGGDRVASLWGSHFSQHSAPTLRQRMVSYLSNRRTFVTDCLSAQRLAQIADELDKFRPQVIVGYVNSLMEFARYLRLTGRRLGVGLKCVITAAEPLSQAQREVLGQAYGCGIFNRYGSRECGLIAMECSRHRGLHVDCENLWIDLHERPGLSGARTIVVTKLTEMVMPMIRYDQADYTTAPLGECDCGRCYPVLSDVGGRRLALLHRTDGATVPGEVMVALFGAMPLRSYRVVQQADRSIDVELAPDAGFDDSARGEIDKHLRRLLGDLPCRVRVGESVQTAPSGKLLPVVSYYQPQEAA